VRAQIGEAADRRHTAPIASAMLWAVLCGASVVAAHWATAPFGARLGSYRSGIITIIAFVVAGMYPARKRSLWFSLRWLRWVMRLPRPLALRLVLFDRLETWRTVHLTIGVFAILPFWWHIQASKATMIESVLKNVVVLLVASGFAGITVQDFLPPRMRKRPDQEVRLEDAETGLHALYVEAEEAVLGHSEQLVDAYLYNVRPILTGAQPRSKMFWATLTGADPAPAICMSARRPAVALGADGSVYAGLVDIAERKVRLEHNQFNLRLSVGWLKFHIGLAIVTGTLIAFHVIGVLYFAGF
jgi:hypothetical protein